ncbi:hypothetical protein B0H17DRAFT_1136645 [Mycena rosella]|uniref:Secreted protein n=1 Tax=Mycena rosella TaxID=1033263 RepID=A0AAD7GBM0_MYCRO|nr:hypothetical protein B0H17DRAFT_1136645 [Mycena rosella]
MPRSRRIFVFSALRGLFLPPCCFRDFNTTGSHAKPCYFTSTALEPKTNLTHVLSDKPGRKKWFKRRYGICRERSQLNQMVRAHINHAREIGTRIEPNGAGIG